MPEPGPRAQLVDPEERVDLLLRHLATRRDGLHAREAARRLEQYGSNEIRRREAVSHARDLLRQFTHPLALLLWGAAVLAVVGGIVALAIAIVVVIILNAVFAFAQELQAERATEACSATCRHAPGCGGTPRGWRFPRLSSFRVTCC